MKPGLRVISGLYKGVPLRVPAGLAVRPTTGRVRQRVFDTLAFLWEGSSGWDAFSGSGAIAIEALSRGTRTVWISEREPLHRGIIEQNLKRLNPIPEAAHVFRGSAETWLKQANPAASALDWVYFDPPYGYAGMPALLEAALPRVARGGFIIVEQGTATGKFQPVEAVLSQCPWVQPYKQLACGDTVVDIFMVQ
jgi:16S rRNA (guanine966-N2)-methyltransferase